MLTAGVRGSARADTGRRCEVTDVSVEAVGTEDRQVSVLDVVASPLLAPEATPAAPAVAMR